jgi:hypothetical protein
VPSCHPLPAVLCVSRSSLGGSSCFLISRGVLVHRSDSVSAAASHAATPVALSPYTSFNKYLKCFQKSPISRDADGCEGYGELLREGRKIHPRVQITIPSVNHFGVSAQTCQQGQDISLSFGSQAFSPGTNVMTTNTVISHTISMTEIEGSTLTIANST